MNICGVYMQFSEFHRNITVNKLYQFLAYINKHWLAAAIKVNCFFNSFTKMGKK